MNNTKVWYVTGASQGLALTLVKKLLAAGYRVAATSRNAQVLKTAVGIIDSERFLPLAADLGNPDCIRESVEQTLRTFGQIDVVVNNAGYGMTGTLEETTGEAISRIFEVNVLAAIHVIRQVVPVMRRRQSGYIINIGSIAGFSGAPGWSVYSATKAALAALSEVLAQDLAEFGIRVTVVEPAGFRTGFLTAQSLALNTSAIEGYTAVKATQERYLAADGRQPGNPERAAEILMQLASAEQVPLHLYLGRDAYERASAKLAAMTHELASWKAVTLSADFDAVAP
jgi:NAD(P)-dependent dehydrogenase (short-subunit alcohol dehydrogenase family)